MTTELWILAACALLAPMLTFPILVGRTTTPGGSQWGLGNRETPMEFPDWVRRAERAHGNLLENLPTFAVFVLIAHLTQVHTSLTVAGAGIFLGGARLARARPLGGREGGSDGRLPHGAGRLDPDLHRARARGLGALNP